MTKKIMKLLMVLTIIGMATTIVSANDLVCEESEKSFFSECYGINHLNNDNMWFNSCDLFDLNNDLKISLSDVSLYAKACYTEEIIEEKEILPEPVKKTKSRSVHVSVEEDGSYTYRTSGVTIQHIKDNMIVSNKKHYEGMAYWGWKGVKYQGTFTKAYGYNWVNIKEMRY